MRCPASASSAQPRTLSRVTEITDEFELATGRRRPVRSSSHVHQHLEVDLVAEQANALGRAGQRLEDASRAYRHLASSDDADPAELHTALREVRDATYALLVQRECAGFHHGNLELIRRHYDVPDAAIRLI